MACEVLHSLGPRSRSFVNMDQSGRWLVLQIPGIVVLDRRPPTAIIILRDESMIVKQ